MVAAQLAKAELSLVAVLLLEARLAEQAEAVAEEQQRLPRLLVLGLEAWLAEQAEAVAEEQQRLPQLLVPKVQHMLHKAELQVETAKVRLVSLLLSCLCCWLSHRRAAVAQNPEQQVG
jgi:hypothetical protein